jgi:hypothetical protein
MHAHPTILEWLLELVVINLIFVQDGDSNCKIIVSVYEILDMDRMLRR